MSSPRLTEHSEEASSTAPATPRELLEPLVLAFAPGALLGIQIAGLLFFLNPHWPFEALLFVRASTFYGALLGSLSTVLVLPFTWSRPQRGRRVLPWALVLVFTLSSTLHGVHASHFSYFLPAGINRRLLKTALWLALAAVISFYTALLHSLRHRPYGIRSRVGMTVLAGLAIYVLLERRVAFLPTPESAPRPSSVEAGRQPTVLVVGIASATLDAILPLAERGQLPFFATMLEQGAYARLESFAPTVPDPLWISLASGKLPYRHGILGARRYSAGFLAEGLDFRLLPVGLWFRHWGVPGGELPQAAPATRSALTLWEITSRLGFATRVLGWPGGPQTPAPSGRPATVLAEDAKGAETQFDNLPSVLRATANAMAQRDRALHDLALDALARPEPGQAAAVFVLLPGLETITKRTFGGYSAVEFGGRRGAELEDSAALLASYYALVDGLLKDLWDRLPEPRWLVVSSAYGARVDRGVERVWASVWPQRRLLGQVDGAPDGVLLLRGSGARPGQLIADARVIDLAPTLLYALGYPVARDFDGVVLASAFSEAFLQRRPVTVVPSYETLSGGALGSR